MTTGLKDRKKLLSISIILALLIIAFLFTPLRSFIHYISLSKNEKTIQRLESDLDFEKSDISYSDLNYTHYNPDEFNKGVEQLSKDISLSTNTENIFTEFERLRSDCEYINTMCSLAELNYNINVNNTTNCDEYNYSYNLSITMNDSLMKLGKEILDSDHRKYASKYWSQTEIENYEEYEVKSDKQVSLLAREQSLIAEYNEASAKEYSVITNGEVYTDENVDTLSGIAYVHAYEDLTRKKNIEIGPIFLQLIEIRNELAKTYGYSDYASFCYKEYYNRDYTTDDISELFQMVKDYIIPLRNKLAQNMDSEMMDSLNASFSGITISDQMYEIECKLPKISPQLLESFVYMKKNNLYNISYSPDKLDGGFTTYFDNYDVPFLYNQQQYNFNDFITLIHEFGHYNNYYYCSEESADNPNVDLAEIHSQALELLMSHYITEIDIIDSKYTSTAMQYIIFQKLNTIVEGCLYDEFQRIIYNATEPTLNYVNRTYYDICKEYGINMNENTSEAYDWVLVSHNFEDPFYYISYTLSSSVSMEIWKNSLSNFKDACSTYSSLVENDFSDPFLETLKKCGLTNPFSNNYYKNLANDISESEIFN